jgi:hypothetical protein
LLAAMALACTAYPLLLLASLYGQWLLSWVVLGHRPQPSMDDPKYIDGASWMGYITTIAFIGLIPAGIMALVLNVVHIAYHRLSAMGVLRRALLLFMLWGGAILLLRWDPGLVVYWWLD